MNDRPAPSEFDRVGFRLHERFRPDVPEGTQACGAKGALRVGRIVGAARWLPGLGVRLDRSCYAAHTVQPGTAKTVKELGLPR